MDLCVHLLLWSMESMLSSDSKERKDQNTLERLRAERQAKIDELKEKTNYYITQQLIQRYDTDPAAATVLASKLGLDTGLKVYLGDESKLNAPAGKSNDVEIMQSTGLRNRKQVRSGSAETMLVGEDPTQSYALICSNCHMHNGLARKEEFPYITYYCPHYNAVNRPKQLADGASGSSTLNMACTTIVADADLVKQDSGSMAERVSTSSSPAVASAVTTESNNIVSPSSSPAVAARQKQKVFRLALDYFTGITQTSWR
ncbi:hypothetical protein RND71_009965 [Anisodus tanguticus]|uniref:Lunapark zinc ribbon domain-containing protein n=1 Tax=Anisodus tanguticus TaxID=243964 RepID=A0AAE1SIT0_9SOLA|nr:hypothetical protein RND71_009965 [Anisodus tanguticus]